MCPTLAHTRQQPQLARVLAVSQLLVQDRADRQQEEQEKSQTALNQKQSINQFYFFFFFFFIFL